MGRPRKKIQIGDRFDKLEVIGFVGCLDKKNLTWLVRCDCGTVKRRIQSNLTRTARQSCGCQEIKHGHHRSGRENKHFANYQAMLRRCYNPKDMGYKNYGGRGITVCQAWRESFDQFMQDMGECPEGWTIDRIDPNGNYEPSNCRWADSLTQNRNRRNSVYLTVGGKTKHLQEWSKESGLKPSTIMGRIKNCGWTPEQAVKIPKYTGPMPSRWNPKKHLAL
jgi:hypothetical protein